MPEPYAYSLFCDDIREERGGKTSLIGVYRNRMIVHGTFPVTLPKFCIVAHCILPPSKPMPPIEIMVFLPGDEKTPSIAGPMPTSDSDERQKTDPLKMMHAEAKVIFAPLALAAEGFFRVRFRVSGSIVKAGSLAVLHVSSAGGNRPKPA